MEAFDFDALHLEIGRITVAFAHLEEELVNATSLVIDENDLEIGRLVVEKLNFSQTLDLFELLCRRRLVSKPALAELERLVDAARACARKRNDIVHSQWMSLVGDSFVALKERVRKKSMKRLDVPRVHRHATDLRKLGGEIHVTASSFAEFSTEHLS